MRVAAHVGIPLVDRPKRQTSTASQAKPGGLSLTLGLMRGAAAVLLPGSPLYLYGLYIRDGIATAPSNQAFDRSLRDRNPKWGLRDLEAVAAIAQSVGFSRPVITEMPANNLSVVFRRV